MRVNRQGVGACAVIMTLTIATASAQSPGRWLMQKGAPVPTPEEEYWNATANGKLYLMGGNWSANHVALATYRGKIYVFGGATVESQPNALKSWEYDPGADSWRELPPMPSKRTASVAIEAGGKMYVIGGSDEAGLSVATNEAFDPAANDWYRLPSMPTARHGVVLTALGNRIHAVAGHTAFNGNGAEALHSNVNEIFELTATR